MITLTSRESLLLKAIKLDKVYSFEYPQFETFYSKFKNDELYKYKSIVMGFFALYGDKYSVKEARNLLFNDVLELSLKTYFEFNEEISTPDSGSVLLGYIGELRILPIGVNKDGKYTQLIEFTN